jgi:hypothetical protein
VESECLHFLAMNSLQIFVEWQYGDLFQIMHSKCFEFIMSKHTEKEVSSEHAHYISFSM